MKRPRFNQTFSGATRIAALTCAIAILLAVSARGADEDKVWPEDAIGMEVVDQTLTTFRFEGLSLGTNLKKFKEKFPAAKRDNDRLDEKSGLQCYTLANIKSADAAQFYFFDDKLFQMEIEYKPARIDKQGGMEAIVRTLVKKFGNADNIYMNRRTWHQPNAGRRADFYTSATGAQLVVTDTNLSAIIDAREKRTSLKENGQWGF
jgi:hypothetical protein